MDGLVKKPDLLSFYVASKIPVSQSTRQELLDIDGVTYRLRREIELLECFDRIQCKSCQVILYCDILVIRSLNWLFILWEIIRLTYLLLADCYCKTK